MVAIVSKALPFQRHFAACMHSEGASQKRLTLVGLHGAQYRLSSLLSLPGSGACLLAAVSCVALRKSRIGSEGELEICPKSQDRRWLLEVRQLESRGYIQHGKGKRQGSLQRQENRQPVK